MKSFKDLTEWMDSRGMFSHILMLGVGGYLFYAIYQMVGKIGESSANKVIIYGASAIFAVVGAVMVALGGFALASGHYQEKLYQKRAVDNAETGEESSHDETETEVEAEAETREEGSPEKAENEEDDA